MGNQTSTLSQLVQFSEAGGGNVVGPVCPGSTHPLPRSMPTSWSAPHSTRTQDWPLVSSSGSIKADTLPNCSHSVMILLCFLRPEAHVLSVSGDDRQKKVLWRYDENFCTPNESPWPSWTGTLEKWDTGEMDVNPVTWNCLTAPLPGRSSLLHLLQCVYPSCGLGCH